MKPTENQPQKVVFRKRRSKKTILLHWLIFLLAAAAVISAVPLTFMAVQKIGKAALYGKTQSASMEMQREELPEVSLEDYDPEAVKYKGGIYHYNKDILTFLVMGIDKMQPVNRKPNPKADFREGGQADALFLVSANPHTKEIFVVAINRNALAPVEVYDKYGNYITTQMEPVSLQHGFGTGLEDSCERQVKCVSEMFYKLPIAGYAAINMGIFIPLNDAIGGVELPLLHKVPDGSWRLNQQPGTMVHLMGQDALDYVHERDADKFASANERLERQKQYITAFIPKAVSAVKQDIGLVTRLYDIANRYMVTDIDLSKAVFLAGEMLGYTFNTEAMYSLQGEMVLDEDGFEKFHVDEDALYDLIMQLYYEKIS